MNLKNIKSKFKNTIKQIPIVKKYVQKYNFKKKYKTELGLINEKDPSESNHPSILHFTLNRSASQWVKSVLKRCAGHEGMVHVDWNGMAFHSSYPYLDHLDSVERYEQIFHAEGYLYSAYGGYPMGIPEIKKYKVALVVRDPRDILVSRYFSKKESHQPPPETSDKREEFLEDRAYTQQLSIDEFVLEKQADLRNRYDQYMNCLLERHPNVHVTRYEDMVADVEEWLDSLLEYTELSPPAEIRQEIVEEAKSIQSKDEDPSDHYRKGRPGDHLEKLQPGTIRKLNETFHQVLDQFGYKFEER